jgi:hypothetical protein
MSAERSPTKVEHANDAGKPRSLWIVLAFALTLAIAVSFPMMFGAEKGIPRGLQTTGRIAFLFFCLAYAGGPLETLFGGVFAPLRKSAREFGLAFAAVILVHLGMVVSLCVIGPTPELGVFLLFGPAAALTGLLALISISRVRMLLPQRFWPPIRTFATTYILFVFLIDFVRFSPTSSVARLIAYAPFAALAIVCVFLKLAAWAKPHAAALTARAGLRAVPPKGRPEF